ncbi:MAG: T9SS type A sorting domain-containing protein [Bacteroidales bacterium]|nr:T9SS type A sorting domain-containing protein [Bacteroidales bacterium]
MNLFTKQTRKVVARRFVLLFLTLLALGFKANAQIPTFTEILERYYNPKDIVVRTTAQTPPYGQQFNNYGFEEWETVKTDCVEPINWNSFMTAEGKNVFLLGNLTKYLSNQIEQSSVKRTNATGSYSARIFSKSTMGIVANGNMTTGRIYAGNMTADSDDNYNFTKRSDANFNTAFTSMPDSLTVWVAFKSKSETNAKITTTIHGDTDLKQLAKSGNSPANMVCATADVLIPTTSTSAVVWKRMTVPFTKGSHNDPRYILATFNTNVTPGGGSDGDELYVDDICLIYNPTLNMELLAQTEFDGSNMNIEVPFTLDGSMSVYNLNKSDNVVIAQLSDASGSFANPIELGRVTTNVSGTVNGVLPADLKNGTYKVRVVSTNYPMVSNERDITIKYPYAPVPEVEIALGEVYTKSVAATFTPNADCAEYYFLIATAIESVDAAYIKANGEKHTEGFTNTFENLISNTEYVIYALPVDVEGNNGEMKSLAVKTQAFVPQIEIVRGNFTAKSITATFTPNADCAEYYFMIATNEVIDADNIKANGERQIEVFTNTFENLISNTEYTIYALPVDIDGFYGEIKTINVTTKTLVPEVAIALGEVSTKSVAATFTSNTDCVEYYFLIASATETVDAAYVKTNGQAKTETFVASFENLISNTDYVINALPVDVEGNNGELKSVVVKTQAFVPQIDIERNNFTAKSITATFTPNADCAEYYFMIVTNEVVDAGVIKANGERQTEVFAKTFENLTSNTEYTIYALPVDVDGFNGEIKSVTITTKALVPDVEIIKGEVLTYSFAASFTPNIDCAEYYFLIAESTESVDVDYVKANGEKQTSETTKTWEELLPNTNYTIYALPIDIEGNEGALKSLVVKTKVEAGISEVELEIEKLSETSVTLTVTPNENTVLYHYIVMTKAEADAMGEDAVMQKLNENEDYLTAVDVTTMTVESNVAYYVIAQGKNADDKWGEVTSLEFVVAGPATVEIAVDKLTETSVEVTATPNENAVSYKYIVIEKAEADAMETDMLMQRLEEANELNGIDVWTWTVKSNVEYYVIAQAENADGRIGEMTKVEFIVAGPAAVAIVVEETSETSVEITTTPNEDAVAYHYIVITKAEADEMGEEALLEKLNENEDYLEGVNITEVTIESNVAYYVVAQAKNADNKFGAITKVEFIVEVAGPAKVAIEVNETSKTTVLITATPNENTVAYHYIVIEKAEADSIGEDALLQRLEYDDNYLEGIDEWEWTVKSNVEYYVIAQAKNADDKWGEITKVEFIVINTESVSELNDVVFEIYPNPATEYMRISADSNIESLIIFSIDGNVIYSENLDKEETTIDVTAFAKGSYIIRMISNDKVFIRRIIVR